MTRKRAGAGADTPPSVALEEPDTDPVRGLAGILERIAAKEDVPAGATWQARDAARVAAWGERRAAVQAAIAALLERGCSCCGRPWSLRTIAARIPPTEKRSGWYRSPSTVPVGHATIARIATGAEQVDDYLVRHVGKGVAGLTW